MATFRAATDGEMPVLADLRWTWNSELREPSESRAEFSAAFVEWSRRCRGSHRPYVAVEGLEIIGMAWLALAERPPEPGHHRRVVGDVQSVYVLPQHRARGIGRALVSFVLRDAERLDLEHISVTAGSRARSLYESLGFVAADRTLRRGISR